MSLSCFDREWNDFRTSLHVSGAISSLWQCPQTVFAETRPKHSGSTLETTAERHSQIGAEIGEGAVQHIS